MKAVFIILSLFCVPDQNIRAAREIDNILYPLDKKIMILIEEENRRKISLEKIRKHRAEMPSCPIEIDYWDNLNCA